MDFSGWVRMGPSGDIISELLRNRNRGAENGVQNATLWRALLGVEKTVVEDIEFDEDEELLVAHVRPRARARARGRCGLVPPAAGAPGKGGAQRDGDNAAWPW